MTSGIQGLDAQAQAQYARAAEALAAGKPREAAALAKALVERAPEQPDVLHLIAGIRGRLGDHAGAVSAVQRALRGRPDDAAFCCTLGIQLAASGQLDAAIEALQRACSLQPELAIAWYNLGVLRVRAVRFEEAETALRNVLELAPDNLQARMQLADLLKMAGRIDDAVAVYRKMLKAHPGCGDAWWGLADIKQSGLGNDDIPAMQAALHDPNACERDRIALGFAIARVLDRNDRCTETLGVLREIHAHARKLQPWDAAAFVRGLDAVMMAFAAAPAAVAELGRGAIFIVGLPRSGSTLTEQVLAAHSQVEASGELHDLALVLAEESRERGGHYPDWVASMTDDDWRRLGERYLERTTRWRKRKPFFTDKLPGNWMHIGAIRAMLPGAKVVVCRRDSLETCFSCYRQYMTADGQGWTHLFEDLGAYWNAFDRTVQQWQARYPGFVYTQNYESLLGETGSSVRALLTFCGLPFEDACLAFGRGPREVRSPSAMQVREPLRRDTARASRYGALLDPLRNALGIVDIQSAH
jgi:tetratricopeptide (TPR) repeat protein